MHAIGKTVFEGNQIQEFQVEILGTLENIGPKQSLILARLSGGPIERTGVLQGMSGSPVYIDGKLVGAVAMAFPFAKEPIAGIRPIEEMLAVSPVKAAPRVAVRLNDSDLLASLPKRNETIFGEAKLLDIATPVSFGGFTKATIDRFAPQLRALGLEPVQGVSGGGAASEKLGDPSVLQPGSMISVQLITGDYSVGADGTVTLIDGNQLYAFGHRFLSVGATDLPFSRSEVVTLLPSLNASFKISNAKELMGVIAQDRNTAISGVLGQRAAMVPVSITVGKSTYRMNMVNDRFLSPFLLQMAVFSSIDATERTVGSGSFALKGSIEFEGLKTPVKLDNMFAADTGAAAQVALNAAVPLAYVMQGGFDALRVKQVSIDVVPYDEKKQLQIDQVYAARPSVRPGEPVELLVDLSGEDGVELTRRIQFNTPEGITPGPLYFTVSDAMTRNLTEIRPALGNQPRSPSQLVDTVNDLKENTKAYIRVWRPETAFQVQGEDFPSPPPSLAMILARGQTPSYNSKLAELEVDGGGSVISGSKTIQVEVKE
jgi:SpoIVB peptidase S55